MHSAPRPSGWPDTIADNRRVRRCLQVFAREPQPGQVKTRLIPALGKLGAAALYRTMLQDTLEIAADTACECRQLWVDRTGPDPQLTQLAQARSLQVRHQVGADLGQRMHHALTSALCECDAAVLIGSDCPEYRTSYLAAAFAALEQHPVVLGPAADGGYVLIGLRQAQPKLFTDLAWGGNRVLHETRQRLRESGLDWHELATLHDLDRPDDLAHFPHLLERAGVRSIAGD